MSAAALIDDYDLDIEVSNVNLREKRKRKTNVLKLDFNEKINIFILFNKNDKLNRVFLSDGVHNNFQNLLRFLVQLYLLYDKEGISKTQNYKSIKDVINAAYSESVQGSNAININKFSNLINSDYPHYMSVKFPVTSDLDDEDIADTLSLLSNSFKDKIKKLDKKYLAEIDDALSAFNSLDNENIEGFLSGRYRNMEINELQNKVDNLINTPGTSSESSKKEELISALEDEIERQLRQNESGLPYDKIFAKGISTYKKFKK